MNYVPIKKYSKSQTIYEYDDDTGLPLVAVKKDVPFYLKVNGKEIYPKNSAILNQRYALDENKLPYYPKDENDKEWYMPMPDKDSIKIYIYHDNSPVYAFDRGVPYYAKKSNGDEFYAWDKDLNDVYMTVADKQIYAETNDNSQFYAKTFTSPIVYFETYALDRGVPYYAKYFYNEEFYAMGEPEEATFITIDNQQIYAKYSTGSEKYLQKKTPEGHLDILALNAEGKPYYATDHRKLNIYPTCEKGQYYMTYDDKQIYVTQQNDFQIYAIQTVNGYASEIYALDERQQPYYAKDNALEYYATTHELGDLSLLEDDTLSYPIYAEIDNKQIYAKDTHSNEYYAKFEEMQIVALDNNVPYYAKAVSKTEYYPRDNSIPYYASLDNRQIYAKNENLQEFYISFGNRELYARNDKDEIYARDSDHHQYYATDNKNPYFATLANGNPYYAQNSKGQDFYFALAKNVDGEIVRPNRPVITFIENPTKIVRYSDFLKNIKRTPWRLLFGVIVAIFVAILIAIKTLPFSLDRSQQHVFSDSSKG